MLKGWMFEAMMVGLVIVMMGQMLDQSHEQEIEKSTKPAIEMPRA